MRLHVEALEHKKSCFITLTYDEENIPDGQTLVTEDLQRFIKKLRNSDRNIRIRYYAVGEYGDGRGRPHYHAIIYGVNFPDRQLWRDRGDYCIYTSRSLTQLWPHGISTVQDNSVEAAAYVSRYVIKKITGEKAAEHYETLDPETGEIYRRIPEFARMSRNPGIGSAWLKKYHGDLYPKGYVTDGKGKKTPPPEYFNKLFKKWYPEAFEKLRAERREEVFDRYKDFDPDRALARDKIQTANHKLRGGQL